MYSCIKLGEVCKDVEAIAEEAEEAQGNNDRVEYSKHDLIVQYLYWFECH